MENKGNAGEVAPRGDSKPNYWRRPDSTQLADGYYHLRQGDEVVGKLLVQPGYNSGETVVHWGLFTTYRWPSSSNTTESITFEYQGPHGTLSVADFKSTLPSGSTYVKAACQQETV